MVRIKSRWLLINIHFAAAAAADSSSTEEQNNNVLITTGAASTSSSSSPLQLQLLRLLRDALQQTFGDVGAGAFGGSLAVRYYSPTTNNAIVRCARHGMPYVWAALTFCDEFAGRKARFTVTHCGGAIRKVQQAAIRADRRTIERLCVQRKYLARQAAATAFVRKTTTKLNESLDTDASVVLDEQAQHALEASQREINAIEQ